MRERSGLVFQWCHPRFQMPGEGVRTGARPENQPCPPFPLSQYHGAKAFSYRVGKSCWNLQVLLFQSFKATWNCLGRSLFRPKYSFICGSDSSSVAGTFSFINFPSLVSLQCPVERDLEAPVSKTKWNLPTKVASSLNKQCLAWLTSSTQNGKFPSNVCALSQLYLPPLCFEFPVNTPHASAIRSLKMKTCKLWQAKIRTWIISPWNIFYLCLWVNI